MDHCLINVIARGLECGYWFEWDKTNYRFVSPSRTDRGETITKAMGPIYIAIHHDDLICTTPEPQTKDLFFLKHLHLGVNLGMEIISAKTKNNFIIKPRYPKELTEIYELGLFKFKIPVGFWEIDYFDVDMSITDV